MSRSGSPIRCLVHHDEISISGRPTRSSRARNQPFVAVSATTPTMAAASGPKSLACSSSTTMMRRSVPRRNLCLSPVEPFGSCACHPRSLSTKKGSSRQPAKACTPLPLHRPRRRRGGRDRHGASADAGLHIRSPSISGTSKVKLKKHLVRRQRRRLSAPWTRHAQGARAVGNRGHQRRRAVASISLKGKLHIASTRLPGRSGLGKAMSVMSIWDWRSTAVLLHDRHPRAFPYILMQSISKV